jgi:hypothetical protein
LTYPRSAFRLKNILHASHEITPKCEHITGAPQILHLFETAELFEDGFSMINTRFLFD